MTGEWWINEYERPDGSRYFGKPREFRETCVDLGMYLIPYLVKLVGRWRVRLK